MSCVEIADVAEELALGMLTGVERARALEHLGRCGTCGNLVRELSRVADSVFELAAPVEPPVGFESRVLAKVTSRPGRPRRGWVWSVAAAAVGAAAAAAATLVVSATGTSPARPAQVLSAPLVAAGHPVGAVLAYGGSPGWVYMSVDLGEMTGTVTCELSKQNGTTVRIGTFVLHAGYGYWDAQVRTGFGQVTAARLVDENGVTVASAKLSQ